eukprot:9043718-Pyramimonas_sp.AAC.1
MKRSWLKGAMAEVLKTFETERVALAMAARVREQELIEQLHHQTAAVKRQAEVEGENQCIEFLASERQAVAMATNKSISANAVAAAAAAARVEGEHIAAVRAEREKQSLQEELKDARLEAVDTQA